MNRLLYVCIGVLFACQLVKAQWMSPETLAAIELTYGPDCQNSDPLMAAVMEFPKCMQDSTFLMTSKCQQTDPDSLGDLYFYEASDFSGSVNNYTQCYQTAENSWELQNKTCYQGLSFGCLESLEAPDEYQFLLKVESNSSNLPSNLIYVTFFANETDCVAIAPDSQLREFGFNFTSTTSTKFTKQSANSIKLSVYDSVDCSGTASLEPTLTVGVPETTPNGEILTLISSPFGPTGGSSTSSTGGSSTSSTGGSSTSSTGGSSTSSSSRVVSGINAVTLFVSSVLVSLIMKISFF